MPFIVELIEDVVPAIEPLPADKVVLIAELLELKEVHRILELDGVLGDGVPLLVELIEDDVPATVLLAADEVVLIIELLELREVKSILELEGAVGEGVPLFVELSEDIVPATVLLAADEVVLIGKSLELDGNRPLVVEFVDDVLEVEPELLISGTKVGEKKVGLDVLESCDAYKLEAVLVGAVLFATTLEDASDMVSAFVEGALLEFTLAEAVLAKMVLLEEVEELFVLLKAFIPGHEDTGRYQ